MLELESYSWPLRARCQTDWLTGSKISSKLTDMKGTFFLFCCRLFHVRRTRRLATWQRRGSSPWQRKWPWPWLVPILLMLTNVGAQTCTHILQVTYNVCPSWTNNSNSLFWHWLIIIIIIIIILIKCMTCASGVPAQPAVRARQRVRTQRPGGWWPDGQTVGSGRRPPPPNVERGRRRRRRRWAEEVAGARGAGPQRLQPQRRRVSRRRRRRRQNLAKLNPKVTLEIPSAGGPSGSCSTRWSR